jgi:type I restriction enzyme S subunit
VFGQPVVLPPSAEQKRIVAKLDAILSRISAGEAAAHRVLVRLKRYRASVLHAAVTGELTREWRNAHPKPTETGTALLRHLLAARRTRWEETELARLTKSGKPGSNWKARYPKPVEPDITDFRSLPRGWAWASVDQLIVEPIKNGLSIKGSS